MKMKQARAQCPHCGNAFGIQVYMNTREEGWTLYTDGYRHSPMGTPPWHAWKICPHCAGVTRIGEGQYELGGGDELPSGDAPSPRERVRAALAQVGDEAPEVRRDAMLLDLWISNHICGAGADDYTRARMRELLDPDNGLDPVIRADIQRQIGRFEAAREGLLSVQRRSKEAGLERKRHIKSVLALVARGVKEALPVMSDGAVLPPTGRLALTQHKS